MSKSGMDVSLRLARLERVLQGRRARLQVAVARQRRSTEYRPLNNLQRYGYPLALALLLTAVLPTMVGFAFRHRKLLAGTAANGVRLTMLRRKFDSVRRTESGR